MGRTKAGKPFWRLLKSLVSQTNAPVEDKSILCRVLLCFKYLKLESISFLWEKLCGVWVIRKVKKNQSSRPDQLYDSGAICQNGEYWANHIFQWGGHVIEIRQVFTCRIWGFCVSTQLKVSNIKLAIWIWSYERGQGKCKFGKCRMYVVFEALRLAWK